MTCTIKSGFSYWHYGYNVYIVQIYFWLIFGVIFCRINTLKNKVLFLSEIKGVFMLPL